MYVVRLKPGHPTGIYHRAGLEFSSSAPTTLEKLPREVKNDPWLIVEETDKKKGSKESE